VRRIRRPIRDFCCPTADEMRETLDVLDRELEGGSRVYLHCRGGIGRTGIVTACYLMRHGATADDALARLRVVGKGPEHQEQLRFVEGWSG
jgi:protein-tyrosine phosphatase